jgi:hypothetical protein
MQRLFFDENRRFIQVRQLGGFQNRNPYLWGQDPFFRVGLAFRVQPCATSIHTFGATINFTY